MNTIASFEFAFPSGVVAIAAKPQDRIVQSKDYLVRLLSACTEDGTEVDAQGVSWTQSASLGAPYSYLGASLPDSGLSFARDLVLPAPIISLTVDIRPWAARGAAWLQDMAWEYVLVSGFRIPGAGSFRTTGLAQLEVRS